MKLSDDIFLIYGREKGRYPYSNCILIGNSLIDGGAEEVWNLRPEAVINSHWHEDHIAMNGVAKIVIAHEMDSKAIESEEEFRRRYGLGKEVDLFLSIYPKLRFRKVDAFIEDGDILVYGKNEIEVIHTPGHSAGHCCFLINGEILFLGDIELQFPWYGCLDSDVTAFLASIRILKKIQPKVAIPAHGEMVTGEELEMKLSEYENKILERDRKIREIIKAGEDPVGRGIIYRRFPEPRHVYEFFERVMVEKHLEAKLSF
uniref:MBL fold metallo-hydrolase n=1 Tax=Archaeoglobus fulgidus TaxID=2234 RepID=A0A7J2THC1_ARCFL